MKLKFNQYDMKFQNKIISIIEMPNVDQFFMYGYHSHIQIDSPHWYMNNDSLNALLYASVIMGLDPENKIIYFPIKKNGFCYTDTNMEPYETHPMYRSRYDLVFLSPQTQFKRKNWSKVKQNMKYIKPKTYVFEYDEQTILKYFSETVERWKTSKIYYTKEFPIEDIRNDTVFGIFSKMQFRSAYLGLYDYMSEDPETKFIKYYTKESDHYPGFGDYYAEHGVSKSFEWYRMGNVWENPWISYYDNKYDDILDKFRKDYMRGY